MVIVETREVTNGEDDDAQGLVCYIHNSCMWNDDERDRKRRRESLGVGVGRKN